MDLIVATNCMVIAVVASAIASNYQDGRSHPSQRTISYSSRISQWNEVQANSQFHIGWYVNQFRCSKFTFDRISELIATHWTRVNPVLGRNSNFTIKDRVALLIHYLTHAGSVIESGKVFGMSKSSSIRISGRS